MLVIIGANEYGKKDVLAIMDGFRENADSWRARVLDGVARGLSRHARAALLAPQDRECVGEVLPKFLHEKAKADLQEIWMAETKKEATAAFDLLAETYGVKYEKAVGKLIKDRDGLLAFYDFPAEHWKHIRTTNPIESAFATLWNRTRKTKGCLNRKTALAMVFRLMMSAKRIGGRFPVNRRVKRG